MWYLVCSCACACFFSEEHENNVNLKMNTFLVTLDKGSTKTNLAGIVEHKVVTCSGAKMLAHKREINL